MLWPSFTPRIGGAVTVLKAGAALSVFGLLFIAGAACAELVSSDPLTATEVAAVKAELADRSFRQFDPHVDGDPRKGVILDFFGPLSIWAQYAVGGHALNEWEIVADDYRVSVPATGKWRPFIRWLHGRCSSFPPSAVPVSTWGMCPFR